VTNLLQLALTRRSLARFCVAIQPDYELTPAHKAMIAFLEGLLSGQYLKAAIVAPPRTGKTQLSNILLPAFILGRNPKARIISISYGSELSEISGRKLRNLLTDPVYREIFPDTKLSPDSSAVYRFETTVGGEFSAVGRGGPVTGKGADYVILDDLIKDNSEAGSETICRNIVSWLQTTALTRLGPKGKVLAIQTRWSLTDPMGWFLEQHGVRTLHLPAISLGKERDALKREAGAALWPDRYPADSLEAIRRDIGSQNFNCLFQGDPTGSEGIVFRRSWIQHYTQTPERFSKIVQSWDTAYRAGQQNDFTVCTTWGATNTGYYLLHVFRAKVEFSDLLKKMKMLAEEWKPDEILVEDAGSGISAIQELRNSTTFPVIAVKADKSKIERANACTGFFEAGRVHFPQDAIWLADAENEICGFPVFLHDDVTDSCCQALNRLRSSGGGFPVVEMGKRLLAGILKMPEPSAVVPVQSVPTTTSPSDSCCPNCAAICLVELGGVGTRCNQCGHVWGAAQSRTVATKNGLRRIAS
jgi:predicted phage terminase large subunit-like protein